MVYHILSPVYNYFDLFNCMLIQRLPEVFIWHLLSDHLLNCIRPPTQTCIKVFNSCTVMRNACVHTTKYDLVLKYKLFKQISDRDVMRTVITRDTGDNINPVDGKRVY